MNFAVSFVVMLIGYLSCQVSADCGNQNLRESIDLLKYDRFGRTTRESCRWTFNIPRNESTILMLDIKKFSAFRQGTPQNAHLILPDGRRIHNSNSRKFENNCLLFVRRNFQSNNCLNELASKYCSGPTIEVDQWPPTLSSTSLTSYREGDNLYSYDIDFTFFYMYISCPSTNQIIQKNCTTKETTGTKETDKNKETNETIGTSKEPTNVAVSNSPSAGSYFVSTIAVSALLIIVLGATTITMILLMRKTRKAKAAMKASIQISSVSNNNSTTANEEEDIYENPNYVYAQDPPATSRHPYCQIDLENETPPESTSYHTIRTSEVVDNVLYNM